jgi:hypothetical protein
MPEARPRPAVAQPGRSTGTLIAHGAVGWAICAAVMGLLLYATPRPVAFAVHATVAPIVFAFVARHYFAYRGAHEPLRVAAWFVGITALLDAVVVAGIIQRSGAMLGSFAGFWLPLALIFAVTWIVGGILSMGPIPKERHA